MKSNASVTGYPTKNPAKAVEAELINRATQTAIVAAKSILMAGGTDEIALKTAKKTAESILIPKTSSDNDTVSGRSSLGGAFSGRKRKMKRQAEVVASMALMSAVASLRADNGGVGLHDQGDNGSADHGGSYLNNPYARNIFTVKQDEPSVLSGSFSTQQKPHRTPTPKSQQTLPTAQSSTITTLPTARDMGSDGVAAHANSTNGSGGGGGGRMSFPSTFLGVDVGTGMAMVMGNTDKTSHANDANEKFSGQTTVKNPPLSPSKPAEICIPLDTNNREGDGGLAALTDPDHSSGNGALVSNQPMTMSSPSNFLDKILNFNTAGKEATAEAGPEQNTATKITDMIFQGESESFSNSRTMDSERQSSVEYTTADEGETTDAETIDTMTRYRKKGGTETEDLTATLVQPIMSQLISAMNLVTCTPLGAFGSSETIRELQQVDTADLESIASDARRSKRDKHSRRSSNGRQHHHQNQASILDANNDTFDDTTTNYTCDDTAATEGEGRDDVDEGRLGGRKRGGRAGRERRRYHDADFGIIESRSSGSSTDDFAREKDPSGGTEGNIQVRSSIRDTMEKIVTKSKRNRGFKATQKQWTSYEAPFKTYFDVAETQSTVTAKKLGRKGRRGSNKNKTPSSRSVASKRSSFFSKKPKSTGVLI